MGRLRSTKAEDATPLLVESEPNGYGTTRSVEYPPFEPADIPPKPPRLSQIATRPYIITVANYGLFAFLDMGMSALIPLVYSTPIEYGGLGMDTYLIGILMGSLGLFTGLSTAIFLGPVLRRFGPVRLFQAGVCAFLVTFSSLAMGSMLAKRAGRIDIYVSLAIVLQIAASAFFAPCYGGSSLSRFLNFM